MIPLITQRAGNVTTFNIALEQNFYKIDRKVFILNLE